MSEEHRHINKEDDFSVPNEEDYSADDSQPTFHTRHSSSFK